MERPATCTFCGGELEGSICPRCRHDFAFAVEVPAPSELPYVPQAFDVRQDAPLAGWWARWVGYAIIDQIVIGAIAFAAGFLISVAVYSGAEHWTEQDRANLETGLTLLGLFISFLYFWIANSLGRSIGKLALGLRVVTTEDGTAPGLGRGLVRTIGYYVSSLPLGLGFLWAAWAEDRQAWHDKMAGTIVIKTRGVRKSRGDDRQPLGAGEGLASGARGRVSAITSLTRYTTKRLVTVAKALAVVASIVVVFALIVAVVRIAGAGDDFRDLVFGTEEHSIPTATPMPERLANYTAADVLSLATTQVSKRGSFPQDTQWERCTSATYRPGSGTWVVTCWFFRTKEGSLTPDATQTYLFDDRTGQLAP